MICCHVIINTSTIYELITYYIHILDTPSWKKITTSGDPGRKNFLDTSTFDSNKKLISTGSLMSRREYYKKSGIGKYTKKINDLLLPLQDINAQLSQEHTKHHTVQGVVQGLRVLLGSRDLREEHLLKKKKVERYNLHLDNKKKSVLSKAVNKLQDPTKPDIILILGDASFPSGRRFEKYVPVKEIKELLVRRHDSREVSEHRTSSVCPDCNAQLLTVAEWFNGKFYEVRGLKWCRNNECKSKALKHRDHVGAINIYRRHAGIQPSIMNRGSDEPWFNNSHYSNYHILSTPGQLPPACLRKKHKRKYKKKRV